MAFFSHLSFLPLFFSKYLLLLPILIHFSYWITSLTILPNFLILIHLKNYLFTSQTLPLLRVPPSQSPSPHPLLWEDAPPLACPHSSTLSPTEVRRGSPDGDWLPQSGYSPFCSCWGTRMEIELRGCRSLRLAHGSEYIFKIIRKKMNFRFRNQSQSVHPIVLKTFVCNLQTKSTKTKL